MDNSLLHRKLYDELSKEYERRADSLTAVTEEAMDYFTPYIKSGGLVLDIGCGVGIAMSVLIKRGFKVMGLELSPKMAEFAKKRNPNASVVVGDFLKTKFDDKFDAIVAFAFIHLFPESQIPVVFDKIKSLLNPHGVALISSTESFESKEGVYAKEDFGKKHKRFRKFWTEKELRESFAQNGLEEVALKKIADPFGKTWMDFIVRVKQ